MANRDHPLYGTWRNIINRCSNPKVPAYPRYGGRGITICQEWRKDFRKFVEAVGERPKGPRRMTLDRIDNDKGYEPGNVRWTTYAGQMTNVSYNVNLTVDGVTKNLSEWARETGLHVATLHYRLKRGMTPEETVKTPHLHPTSRRTADPTPGYEAK